ncbi:TonB-dependent receptor [Halospina sp. K52047b]|uniref:TonB-dependent receptor domain-containing protein n=1 Tax=Halospina sp. K52047b TaxID=2614160 RepID=UPI00124AAD75|nr:TonB-dependent receptor [Halospina sp. K52047b]KAA8981201.1 TonB-dependent receptor [Halospina sp. K52047b]
MTNRQAILPLAAAISLSASLSTAQETNGTTQVAAFNMDPLVVTSTLGVETVSESLSSVTVIDSKDLQQRNPRGLGDVLQAQPGINVTSSGSFGKNTSVFTRGTSSESTILLLDGIRIRSATTGGAPWQYIPPQLLQRIEVVRGPKGTLYGSDAVGGVIQGFTTPRDEQDQQWIEMGGGSFSTQQFTGGVSGQSGDTRYSLQGHYLDTDGTNLQPGGEDKGFRNAAGTLSVSHRFDNGASLGVVGLQSSGNTEFFGGETDFDMRTLGVKASTPVVRNWTTSIQLSEARDEQDNERAAGPSFFDTVSRTARWENTFRFENHELIAGTEYRVDDVDSSEPYEEDSRSNKAAFAQLLSEFGAASLQLSGRWDDNEAFGEETTGAVALGYDLSPVYSARVSYGTAFRAPTFNDLYYPGFGDPNLEPETSGTVEVGLRSDRESVFWDVALFRTDVDNLISAQPENIERARIDGLELSGGVSMSNFEVTSAVTFQDPEDRSTGNRLQRRSKRSVRIDADYTPANYHLGASFIAEGDRYNDPQNSEVLAGFGRLDLRAGMDVTRLLSLSVSVDNVFDRRYSTTSRSFTPEFDYLAAGRAVYATISYGAK